MTTFGMEVQKFIKKYPNLTSGDLQTFALGWEAATEANKEFVYTGKEVKQALNVALRYKAPKGETIDNSVNVILHASLNAKTIREALALIEDDQKSKVEDIVFGVHQYPVKSSEATLPNDSFKYVGDKLKAMGHNDKFINEELYVMQVYPSKTDNLADDTCAILTSDEYISNYGSWQS